MKFLKSFSHATRGIFVGFKSERNLKIHALATLIVIILAIILNITLTDFFICFLLIALIWGTELINSAIERICNILRDTYKLPYEGSRDIRDIAAGAVWVQAIIAGVIGILIFGKYL